MAQYTVTGSTSVVLVSNLPAVVLLSSIQYPGHIVGIRDATGSTNLPVQPIVISTMAGLKFYDGTSSLTITNPSTSIIVSSKDPFTWQLLNNVGFFTSLPNAYLSSLTSQFSYINLVSAITEVVSTSVIGRINITNTILLGGNTQITGDIIVNGPVSFLSAMTVQQQLSLSSLLSVGSNFVTTSSLSVRGDVYVGGAMSTLNNLIASSVVVDQSMVAKGILLPYNFSTQTLRLTTLNAGGGIQTAQTVSTASNLFLGQDLLVQGSSFIRSSVTIQSSVAITDGLYTASSLTTRYLSTLGDVTITKEGSLEGSLLIKGISQFNDKLFVKNTVSTQQDARFDEAVMVTKLTDVVDLNVLGDVNISSFKIYSTVSVLNDALSYGSIFRADSDLLIQGAVGVGGSVVGCNTYVSVTEGISSFGNLGVGSNLILGSFLQIGENLKVNESATNVSTFFVEGNVSSANLTVFQDLNILGNIKVGQILGASTLGAFIPLKISTLTLSNTLTIGSVGHIPLLDTNQNPTRAFVGDIFDFNYDLAVEGILQNRDTVTQTTSPFYDRRWYATNVRTSTFRASTLVSSFLIGGTLPLNPFVESYGAVFTGQFGSQSNLYYTSNISSSYGACGTRFDATEGGYNVVYNGSNQWVAVGDAQGGSAIDSILTSQDGYTWLKANTGGFSIRGRSVAYGNGMWVAVGESVFMGDTIQYSMDGSNWTTGTNTFDLSGMGIAYNGSNLWIAVGLGFTGGVKTSIDGIAWTDATGLFPFGGVSVAYGAGRWLVATDVQFANPPPNPTIYLLVTSRDGLNWTFVGTDAQFRTFATNGTTWTAGAIAQSPASPLTSLWYSPNGILWIQSLTGGFTGGCLNIQWDPVNSIYWASGYTDPLSEAILQYSKNGLNWTQSTGFPYPGTVRAIGLGTLFTPDLDNYFTVNTTSIVDSTLSSFKLFTSSIFASTISSPNFFGDGAGVSNVVNFRPYIYTSSIFAGNAYTLDISARRLQTEYATLQDKLTIQRNPFLSSIEEWFAAGSDSQSNGMIQTSFTGLNWIRGIGPSFDQFAKSIGGNCNISTPIYVATGVDSRENYTIQWSENGKIWNPATFGGFPIQEDGFGTGNSVVYNTTLKKWVVAGYHPGTTSTLLYSSDGKNWYVTVNAFADSARFVTTAGSVFVALGDTVKYSGDGINWIDSIVQSGTTFDTVAYGFVSTQTLNENLWLGFQNTDIFFSLDGADWSPSGSNTFVPVKSAVYGKGTWVGVGSNIIQYSQSGVNWSPVINTFFPPDVNFNTVAYNSNQSRWVAGAVSTTADKSLWTTTDYTSWNNISTGGFSTSILQAGAGYGVLCMPTSTFLVGTGSFTGFASVKPNILNLVDNGLAEYITSNNLSPTNASNVFKTQVRSISYANSETYNFVAVGDGDFPQKTIARSLDASPNSWVPAITGGFSTTGYGVAHYSNFWIAVGDAPSRINTIQYSPDGANWFGTNTANAMRIGGRGIGRGGPSLFVGGTGLQSTLVAVGRDTARSSIVYSTDGFTWAPAIGSFFTVQGNAVAGGNDQFGAPNFVAVGQDSRGARSTILRSANGINWSNILTGGFSGGGFGICANLLGRYVAVGADVDSNKTIQYSADGGANFSQVTSGAFTKAGYAVAYDAVSDGFFAVGEDIAGKANQTVKYSLDGLIWNNISTGSGFLSQVTLGSANSLFTQQVLNTQISPYYEFSNFFIYEGVDALLYPNPTLRVQSSLSTFMTFNEAMSINLSTQVVINSNAPYSDSTVLTVNGSIYTSSLVYTGSFIVTDSLLVSSVIVSSLSTINTLNSVYLTTPYLAMNTIESKANFISTNEVQIYSYDAQFLLPTNIVNINSTLYATAQMFKQKTGINNVTPTYDLDIAGSLGTSSFSTPYFFAPGFIQSARTSGASIVDPYFSIVSGSEGTVVNASNSFLATPSSLFINDVLTLNVSTQNVGVFTKNPRYPLDVQRQGYLQTLSTPLLNTSLLFLTLQSVY